MSHLRSKKMYQKASLLLSLLVVIALVIIPSMTVAGQSAIEIEINGEMPAFTDAHPYINQDNRTMVPLRFISENLGAEVGWEGTTQTATVTKGDTVIKLRVDSDLIDVNGEQKQMDTKMILENGRNFVPLRFVSENLGSGVDWEHRNQGTTIFISITDAEPIDTSESDAGIYGISMGDGVDYVIEVLGEPARKDLSAYGYTWWIYNQDYENYLQVGIKDGQVVNIYSNSNHWEYKGLRNKLSLREAKNLYQLHSTLEMEHDGATYTIKQRDRDPVEKYLVFTEDEIAIEIYIDIHDDHKVTAIRFSEPTYIFAASNYSFTFRWSGDRPEHEAAPLTQAQQQTVDRGNEEQLLDLVNVIRVRMNLEPLAWHQAIAKVAYGHSVDMRENNFFSHTSPTAGSMSDRVNRAGIPYSYIAENIAYGQADAIEAHEGLMNSYGHRVNILSPNPTALGTGAYYKHYTQKFINPR